MKVPKQYYSLLLPLVGILVDFFMLKNINDYFILLLTLVWVALVIGLQIKSRLSILACIGLLVSAAFLLSIKQQILAEKAAIWAYMFLLVGVGQQLVEYKKY